MPGAPAIEAKGTTTNTMVLGGRFLQTHSTGNMMGQAVESIGFLGYDRRNEEYVSVGLDTMGTYFVTARGKRGEDGIVRLHGSDDEPMGPQVYTFEIERKSDDEQITRLYFSQMGGQTFDEPFLMLTIRETRQK